MFHSLSEISLESFIAAYCEGDKEKIVKKGRPSKAQLSAAWANLMLDYHDAIGSQETKRYVNLAKQIAQYSFRIEYCTLLGQAYLIRRTEDVKRRLSAAGIHFQATDTDDKIASLIVAQCKAWDIETERLAQQMDTEFKSSGDEGEPVTRQTFITNLIAVNKETGIGTNTQTVTAEVYCYAVRYHNDLVQAQLDHANKAAA